jgi:hypothetical protein
MASNIQSKFGTSGQTITVTCASLANGSARASTAVDNTTTLYLDALVSINIKTGATGTATTGYINVYAYGTADGGTNYTEGATGTDAALTLVSPTNLKLIGIVNAVANATTYKSGPFSVAAAFGGTMPDHWGIVVQNNTGGALDATEGSHLKVYQGVYAQTV